MKQVNQPMITRRIRERGFTLVEIMFSTGIVLMLVLAVFAFMELALRLYAKTLSVGLTEWQSRKAMEFIVAQIQASDGPPIFLDQNGNDLPNSSRAGLGIRYSKWSDTAYNVRDSAALIVVNGNELRYYASNFTTTRLAGTFRVLSRNLTAPLSISAAGSIKENYPFHVTSYPPKDTSSQARMIDLNLKVIAPDYHRFLSTRRQGGILDLQSPNTFLQLRGIAGYRFNDKAVALSGT